ncbi:MAG: immunoglobulin domain-containing protein [Hahellaceae bacterium]|nr:immunoglobulin domain-containing protein [Hahellaceae bacterium]
MRTHSTATKLLQGSLLLAIGLFHTGISQADALAPGTLNVVTIDLVDQNPGNGNDDLGQDTSAYVIDNLNTFLSYLSLDPSSEPHKINYSDTFRIVVNDLLPKSGFAPQIITQPNPAVAYVGQSHSLMIQTTEQESTTYQWWKNGFLHSTGASELILSNLSLEDSGWYKVLATNSRGGVISDTVYLDVKESSPTGPDDSLELPATGELESPPTGTAMIRWTAPTVRVDGSALAPGEITGYRIYQGSEARGWYRYHQVNDPYLNFVGIEGLPADTYYFAISVIDQYGQESEPTALGYKTIAATPLVVGS